MSDWETPFLPNKIGEMSIAINCPRKEMFDTLRGILDGNGVRYASGAKASDSVVEWERYSEDFCFYVSEQKRLWHGPKRSTSSSEWSRFQKHTFYGYEDPDIPDIDCGGQDLFDIACGGDGV